MKTLVLHYGMEGGATKVFRQLLNRKERYFAEESHVDFEDLDVWHKSETEYPSFQAFWQEFTKNDNWFRRIPIFIHKDCKPIIRKSFTKLNAEALQENEQITCYKWLTLLKSTQSSKLY